MRTVSWWVLLIGILLGAMALRLYGLDWDDGIGAHPDERFVVGVAESLDWPRVLNPFDVAPDFAYGHLPLYVLALLGAVSGGGDLLLAGRALAALLDVGSVALTCALARQIYGRRVGLLAAALLGVTVLHVQQAHFYTVDVVLTFCSLGALLFAARFAQNGRPVAAWLAGAWAGLALGCKLSAGLLAVPLWMACFVAPAKKQARWGWALEMTGAALALFVVTNPFALVDFARFRGNVALQSAIVRGVFDVPYTRQFHGTWPYVYPVLQQLRWGMGWLLGGAAFGGLFYTLGRVIQRQSRRGEWVLLAWLVPGIAFFGALYVKFPRYLLPFTPLLAICAAHFLVDLGCWRTASPERRRASRSGSRRRVVVLLAALVFLAALGRCLALVGRYSASHPWTAASRWFYEHAPAGAVIAVEQWDHPLPLDAMRYDVRQLPMFDEETLEKWSVIEDILAQSDYVVVASRRGYGALARWPTRYPRTTRYYRQLFEGELGFETAACFGRAPRLGPIAIVDDVAGGLDFALPARCQPDAAFVWRVGRLDESFVVYDHPQAVIFAQR
ncbi:MAG TPA: phospholipid carrier-dependent glycosyltransferase [Chloroflexi bacterium]|nr:phospholipid carrier-dependent glycosyltransferase [Chloroflexota bacterium]